MAGALAMRMFSARWVGTCVLLTLLGAGPSGHTQPPRYASLIEERRDGALSADSAAEIALVEAMLAGGASFVDENQSRKIRSVTSAGRLLKGGISEVITSLDADFLIVGLVQVDTFKSRILNKRATRMEANLQAKVIEVATGRVVYAGRKWAKGLHFTKSEAARIAARGAATKLAEELLARAPSKAHSAVELSIEGPLPMSQLQSLQASIAAFAGVDKVEVVAAGIVCKLLLQIEPTMSTEALALKMDGVLQVNGFDRSTISAKLRPSSPAKQRPRIKKSPRSTPPKPPGAPGSTPRIFRVHTEHIEIYPALRVQYEGKVGVIKLDYQGESAQPRALISVSLGKLTLVPTILQVGSLAPGASNSVPFGLVLSGDALADLESETQQVLRVDIEAGAHKETHEISVRVHAKNALNWAHAPSSIAAFVSHEAATVRILASEALAQLGSPSALGPSAALFEVLRGLRYQEDPVHPGSEGQIDFVKFPTETLGSGFGDCEDLSVLLAALAESVGIATAFVLTQDHVLVLLDTGVAVQGAVTLGLGASRFVAHRGRLWIPLETTGLGAFDVAWQAGLRVTNGKSSREIIETREAWKIYPPVDFGRTSGTGVGLAAGVVEAIKALEAQRRADHPSEASGTETQGFLLAGAGRYPEAEAAFLRSPGKASNNNRANLEVLKLKPKIALALYAQLLSTGPQDLRVSLNAALAAWMCGTRQLALEYVSDAMDTVDSDQDRAVVERFITQLNRPNSAKGTSRTERERLSRLTFWL